MKKGRIAGGAILVLFVVMLLVMAGCEKASSVPPPANVASVLKNVRDGYNAEDADLFTGDFSDIMFTQGFTKQAYLDVIQGLKMKHGSWDSETYLGVEKGVHTWRVKFDEGNAKFVLVLNNDGKVTGLWFR
jgi:hypothetical protein